MIEIDIERHLAELRVDGFTILESLLDGPEIARIKDELAPYLRGELMGRNDFEGRCTERVYALLAKAPSIAAMVEHPATLSLLDRLLPRNYLLSAALAIHVHPGETPQPFHSDDGAGGLGLPKPRRAFGYSTIWALDDFTTDNGATEVIPGSHHWPSEREPNENDVHKVIMHAGSAVLFDGTLLHRGGANVSDHTRLAVTPQYCAPGLRQIENMVLAVPPKLARQYSNRLQSLLGYSIIDPGFMGYVDGRHPKTLIDPDYRGRKHRDDLPAS
jgi:ectoine hydroxylase-related dioxygenase (phytanoyl-CoA dioxygenase family)